MIKFISKNWDFLLLSWLSGIVEIGCILFGLSHGFSIYEVVGLGLAYQLGNLLPNPIQLSTRLISFFALIAAGSFLFSLFEEYYILYFFGFCLLSAAIQSIRAYNKQNVSTGLKRSYRILGFIFAPLLNLPLLIVITLIIFLISLRYWQKKMVTLSYNMPRLYFIDWLMIVHQIHYFSYSYFVLFLIYQATESVWWVSIWFCCGWITYTSISYFLRSSAYFTYFIIGHLFLSVVLLLLGKTLTIPSIFILLWIMTGFGGGTVFCIDKISELYLKREKNSLVFSENVGHVIGVLAGLGLFYFTQSLAMPVYLGAFSAFVAMLMMATLQVKFKHKPLL